MKKIGIMGGTFDPIHIGHLILGEQAYQQFDLDQVLFMPSGNPPHKTVRIDGASNEQRLEMVKRAIDSNPHFSLSGFEMDRRGFVYTSDTLRLLKEENPGTEYYFIMGADSLINFDTWHEPAEICKYCIILAAVRDDMAFGGLDDLIGRVSEKYGGDIRLLRTPNMDVASSALRRELEAGRSCRYLIPDRVLQYIKEQKLYGRIESREDH